MPKAGLPISYVYAAGYAPPRRLWAFLKFGFKLGLGCLQSLAILLRFKPDYILATGGYVSAPVIFSHALLSRLGLSRAKVVLHEANAVAGKLNALMAPYVDYLFLTFPRSRGNGDRAKGLVAGYPVRKTLERLKPEEARKRLSLPLGRRIVLIFGGSQGARSINQAVVGALESFRDMDDPPFILHGVGLGSLTHHPLEETITLLKAGSARTGKRKPRISTAWRHTSTTWPRLTAPPTWWSAGPGPGPSTRSPPWAAPPSLSPSPTCPGITRLRTPGPWPRSAEPRSATRNCFSKTTGWSAD